MVFGHVRVHTDEKAAESAAAMGVSNRGQYRFCSRRVCAGDDGREKTVGAELTHTMQQQGHAQGTIQRKSSENVLAVDGGPIAHADGKYVAATGTLTTPANPAGYVETRKTDPENLYDTISALRSALASPPAT